VENLREVSWSLSVAPEFQRAPIHEGRAYQTLMRVNIGCHICLQQATVINYFAQMLSLGRIQPFL